jgi:hypothetical protein
MAESTTGGGVVGVSGLPTPTDGKASKPNTQDTSTSRDNWPEWMKELPRWNFKPDEPDIQAPLIKPEELEEVLKESDPEVVARIKADIHFMDYELLRLFRQRDYEAKKQQNRYRKFQLLFVVLAALATFIGSLQALALSSNPRIMPIFAFSETLVALSATYLATISGREAPMPLWLANRRRAEQMRREYFRYILNLAPYDSAEGYKRQMMLSKRAADINRGVFPEETADAGENRG